MLIPISIPSFYNSEWGILKTNFVYFIIQLSFGSLLISYDLYKYHVITPILGIYNYEEYLLVRDNEEAEKERSMTLKRAHQSGGLVGTLRDADKMEKLRKELHTDDEGECFLLFINKVKNMIINILKLD